MATNHPAGFGRAQLLLVGYTGLAWLADACETMLMSFLGPAVHCYWSGIGPTAQSLLTSVIFAAMLFGVSTLGVVADQFGRRRGFLASALLMGAAGLASAFAPSFTVRACGGPAGVRCAVCGAVQQHRA